MNNIQDINYAIPETTRPPIYTCMKYWGKKPHNVWGEYIKRYVPEDGVYLDPFAGSGMSGIEAIRAGRKAICLDINPLTTFVFDVYCSKFESALFSKTANSIIDAVKNSIEYKTFFLYEDGYILHNAKYKNSKCYEVCFVSLDEKSRFERYPTEKDKLIIENMQNIAPQLLFPNKPFRNSSSFSNAFKNKIGTVYSNLFTNRNLSILSLLFNKIIEITDRDLKLQLLFAFIQSVHLCTKMCVPRSKKTRRDYSTSWGRSAYFSASSEMEMNPLLVFAHNCFGKQSVSSCLENLKKYVGHINGINITNLEKVDLRSDYNLFYGIKDSRSLSKIIEAGRVDFVITDPPYGGLVQYLDLSYIWLAWLELYDPIYMPTYENEITINSNKTPEQFRGDMTDVLSALSVVSKYDAKIVLTFNNKESIIWKAMLGAIWDSGYCIEKVIHQQNLRSGESNVADKYGTSASDFYIRCIKRHDIHYDDVSHQDAYNFIANKAKEIIRSRQEPTPYQILFNGIIAEISIYPQVFEAFDENLKEVLELKNNEFEVIDNLDSSAGQYWWLKGENFDSNSAETLTNRIKNKLQTIFQDTESIHETELLSIIYKEFPNGLSPDREILEKIITGFALKRDKLWVKK